jgi:hypothetical protein
MANDFVAEALVEGLADAAGRGGGRGDAQEHHGSKMETSCAPIQGLC